MLSAHPLISIIPVVDPARARAFYGDTLGLRFVSDDGFAVVFEAGGRQLRVTRVEALTAQPFAVLGWQVPSIEATVRDLSARGVVFERYEKLEQDELGIWSVPDGSAKVAWFKDPDGNVLSVVEGPAA